MMAEIQMHDVVALTEDMKAPKFCQEGEILLCRGLVGTVVEIYNDGEAYEVEFSYDTNGQAYAMISITPEKLLVLRNEPVELVLAG